MKYPSNFQNFMTLSMCSNHLVHQKSINQPKTNKMAATGGQIKQFFNANTENAIKNV